MPLSRRYCVPFIGFLSQMHSSSLRCAVLGAGDRCEWFHRMPQLIFRLYHAIWDCFTDIQELLHLGNEKKSLSIQLITVETQRRAKALICIEVTQLDKLSRIHGFLFPLHLCTHSGFVWSAGVTGLTFMLVCSTYGSPLGS